MVQDAGFEGAKVALFLGDQLAVILRDNIPGLSFAGYWDFPGGGREGDETPLACAARECHEELGLLMEPGDLVWSRQFNSAKTSTGFVWFFVARLPEQAVHRVRFGDEGQGWTLMSPARFMMHPKAVPAYQERLGIWMRG